MDIFLVLEWIDYGIGSTVDYLEAEALLTFSWYLCIYMCPMDMANGFQKSDNFSFTLSVDNFSV